MSYDGATLIFAKSMNGSLFFDLSFAFVMFGIFVAEQLRREGLSKGYDRMRVQAAVSLMMLLFGEMILRSWFWLYRLFFDWGWKNVVQQMDGMAGPQVGMFVQMLGVLCLIRVFTPDDWSPRTWIAVGIFSFVAATAIAFAPDLM